MIHSAIKLNVHYLIGCNGQAEPLASRFLGTPWGHIVQEPNVGLGTVMVQLSSGVVSIADMKIYGSPDKVVIQEFGISELTTWIETGTLVPADYFQQLCFDKGKIYSVYTVFQYGNGYRVKTQHVLNDVADSRGLDHSDTTYPTWVQALEAWNKLIEEKETIA